MSRPDAFRRGFTGVRARLLLLGLLAVLPPMGLLVHGAAQIRERDVAAAKDSALRMARIAGERAGEAIEEAREFLRGLSANPLVLGEDRPAQSAYLAELLGSRPNFLNLGVCGSDGFLRASGLPAALPLDVKERSFFRRAMASRRFSLSDYQLGLVSGRPSLHAAMPVFDARGGVHVVLFAALSLDALLRPEGLAELDPRAASFVLDLDGVVLYRHPEPAAYVGRPVAEVPAMREILARGQGTLEGKGLDGVPRLMGFVGLRGGGDGPVAYVAVTLPRAAAYAVADRILAQNMLAMAVVAAFALAAIWYFGDVVLVRRIDRLAVAARRVTEGDLGARTGGGAGGGELGELERSFDGMAASLQALTTGLEQRVRERTLELERAQEQLEAFFQHSIDLAAVADLDGRFKRLNPAWEKTLGWSLKELLARPWMDFVHPDDRAGTLAEAEKLSRGAAVLRFENRYRCKDGSYRWVSWRVPAPAPGSTVLYATARDVTDLKAAMEEIRELNARLEDQVRQVSEANQELEAFSYSVSHDLRAPLRHLDGFVQLLDRRVGPGLDETARRYLGVISDSARKMGQLIDDLLSFSRVGRADLMKRRVALEELVRDCVGALQAEADGRTIRWDIGPLPAVDGDPVLLRQAFMNLLSNAVKYTGRRTEARIEVGASASEGEAVVFVKDNGAGFDPRYAHKLFGVFQRLHRSEEFEGTGIGLAIVRRVVERHGGRAWAEGRPGEGASFFVAFPDGEKG